MMEIYNAKPDGNEASDLQAAHYFNFAIEEIEKESKLLETRKEGFDIMRLHIDVLLHLNSKYPQIGSLLIEKKNVKKWEKSYFDWFERVKDNIPEEHRGGIRESAISLFDKLIQFGF